MNWKMSKPEEPLYRCKKCKGTNIEAVYYFPHAVGFVQDEMCLKITYRDTDEVQLTRCLQCGNTDDYGLERIEKSE